MQMRRQMKQKARNLMSSNKKAPSSSFAPPLPHSSHKKAINSSFRSQFGQMSSHKKPPILGQRLHRGQGPNQPPKDRSLRGASKLNKLKTLSKKRRVGGGSVVGPESHPNRMSYRVVTPMRPPAPGPGTENLSTATDATPHAPLRRKKRKRSPPGTAKEERAGKKRRRSPEPNEDKRRKKRRRSRQQDEGKDEGESQQDEKPKDEVKEKRKEDEPQTEPQPSPPAPEKDPTKGGTRIPKKADSASGRKKRKHRPSKGKSAKPKHSGKSAKKRRASKKRKRESPETARKHRKSGVKRSARKKAQRRTKKKTKPKAKRGSRATGGPAHSQSREEHQAGEWTMADAGSRALKEAPPDDLEPAPSPPRTRHGLARKARRSSVTAQEEPECPACRGQHRAHTCGKAQATEDEDQSVTSEHSGGTFV